jgi:hypothetical protein
MFELTNSGGWEDMKKMIRERVNEVRLKLEKCSAIELPNLQGQIEAMRFIIHIPDAILDEFQREKERDAAKQSQLTETEE